MSNEDLLREGECPRSDCIEPVGHSGPHSGETMLTKDEALQKLQKRLEQINSLDLTHAGQREQASSLLGSLAVDLNWGELGTALSSPCATCEGRKVVDECGAEIYDVRGGTARASAHIKVYGEDLQEGQVLHCLVFLPAEEKP